MSSSYINELNELIKLGTLSEEYWNIEVRFLEQFLYKYKNQHRQADFYRTLYLASRKMRHVDIFRFNHLQAHSNEPEHLEFILEQIIDGLRFSMVSTAHCIPAFLRQIGMSHDAFS